MDLNLFTVTALAGELHNKLAGVVISEVSPLPLAGLCLRTAGASAHLSLCISTHAHLFGPFLCSSVQHGDGESSFVQNMRRLLCRHTITSIRQWQHDRVLHVQFQKIDEIYGLRRRVLILELIPRYQNLILMDLDSGLILETLRRVTGKMSRFRHILPGHPYQPPPQIVGLHPRVHSADQFLKSVRLQPQALLSEALIGCAPWISAHRPGDLSAQLNLDMKVPVSELNDARLLNLWQNIGVFIQKLEEGPVQPTLVLGQKSSILLPYEPKLIPVEQKFLFATISQAMEKIFHDLIKRVELESDKKALLAGIHRVLHRDRRTMRRLQANLSNARRAEEFKKLGEVIAASMGQLKRGLSAARLPDPYSARGQKILVPLDPRLGPAENAQRYFKRFRKAKAGLPIIEGRLKEVRLLLDELEGLREVLQATSQKEGTKGIKTKLSRLGIQIPSTRHGRPQRVQKPKNIPPAYPIGDGWTIFMGRNNRENDLLTHRIARPRDLWFHAQGVPGSHVILRREGHKEEPSKKVLEQAASLAAHFSRARHAKLVPVVYTEKRYVRKPKGAQPGLVVIEREKTLFVEPKLIKRTAEKNK